MDTLIRRDRNRDVMCVGNATLKGRPFTDFGGANSNGNHHFNIQVPEENLEALRSFGFNPYYLDGKDGQFDPEWILDCVIGYKFGDPGVVLVAYNGAQTPLKEDMLHILDEPNISIAYVDMNLSKHYWEKNGKKGIKPYASKIYIYLSEPSYAEQRYQERFGVVAQGVVEQPESVQPEIPFTPVEDEDIPF